MGWLSEGNCPLQIGLLPSSAHLAFYILLPGSSQPQSLQICVACLALSWPRVEKAPFKPLSLAGGSWAYFLCTPRPALLTWILCAQPGIERAFHKQ